MSNKLTDNSSGSCSQSPVTGTGEDFMLQVSLSISVLHQHSHSTCADLCHTDSVHIPSPIVQYSRRIPLKTTVNKSKVFDTTVYKVPAAMHTVSAAHRKSEGARPRRCFPFRALTQLGQETAATPVTIPFHLSSVATFLLAEEETSRMHGALDPWNVPLQKSMAPHS